MNATESLVTHLLQLAEAEVPINVCRKAQFCLLDFVGEAIAGSKINRGRMSSLIREMECGTSSTVLGLSAKSSMQMSALINGFNAHSTEMDDGHRYGMLHVGASVIPAVIASAEKESLGLQDVIRGIVMGYEAAILIASCLQPSHKKRGYHTSGTCGTVGAAIGVAILNRYTRDQLLSTLAMASTSAAGILEIQEDKSELKPYNIARAAMDGLTAAYFGKTGWSGPDDVIGGKRGLIKVLSDNEPDIITFEDKNYKYAIEGIYMKPYASCRHCHAPIEAAIRIVKEQKIPSESISSILVETYSMAVLGHDHTEILGPSSAKLSIPFSVALAVATRDANLSQFEDLYDDPKLLDLTRKVRVVENKNLSAVAPAKRAAIVTVNTVDGKSYSCTVEYPLGEPENPMTEENIINKFVALAEFAGIPSDKYNTIIKRILK